MMWLARLKPLAAVAAAALIIAAAVAAVQGGQKSAPAGARDQVKIAQLPKAGGGGAAPALPNVAANQAIARKQLALIDDALAMLNQLARNARVDLASPSFALWEHRRMETLRKAGAGKAEIVAALEKTIDSLRQIEAIAKNRVESARGTQVEVYDVQFRRMEAEIWLNEERAR